MTHRIAIFVLYLFSIAAQASVIGLPAIQYSGYPDYSQVYTDNTFEVGGQPVASHPVWWGTVAANTCSTCGPTTATDAFSWLTSKFPALQRLMQVNTATGYAGATPGVIIEELAVDIGRRDNPVWDPTRAVNPSTGPFPGTRTDLAYELGQQDFLARRGAPVVVSYNPSPGFGDFVSALMHGLAIEFSNVRRPGVDESGHWFAISGARTDSFFDLNENGTFDQGTDQWISDYNGNGVFDAYLFVDNPWPGAAMQDWEVYSRAADGHFYLTGDPRPLDSAVFLRAPEPATVWLLLIAGCMGLLFGKRACEPPRCSVGASGRFYLR